MGNKKRPWSKITGLFLTLALLAMMLGAVVPAFAVGEPSVSIDPATQSVSAGDSFSIDVMVDASTYDLKGCEATVSYDSTAMSTSAAQVTKHNLLGGMDIGPTLEDGTVTYSMASATAVSAVSGSMMTIEFTVSDTATAGVYDLTISAEMRDENNDFIPGVVTNDGSVTVEVAGVVAPSLSIDPATQDTVSPGGSFTIDVMVDAGTYDLRGCEVAVSYDSAAMSTSEAQVTEHNLLGDLDIGPTLEDGTVTYSMASATAVSAVSGSMMTIEFTISDTATAGIYDLTISAEMRDENNDFIPGVVTNDGTVVVSIGPTLESIAASPPSVTLNVGASEQLGITATYSDDSTADVTDEGSYVSDDETVATVSDGGLITGVAEGSATVTVSYTESGITATTDVPVTVTGVVTETFTGTVTEDETAYVTTIPEGATELEITLSATADLDLNLYDGDTFVIGWRAIIDSATDEGTYQDDTFAYSGWDGGDEYITADGPLSRAYDLKVYGYEAGDYTVTVSYMPAAPPNPPPTITIDVPATVTLGDPVTLTVSATDPDGVLGIYFIVSSPWPEEWTSSSSSQYEDMLEYVISFSDEASLTFVPGWAGTYTVKAWASDELWNSTPEATPEITTFVVE